MKQKYTKYKTIYKMIKKNMKEYGKRKSHISSKLHVIYISSNNVRYPVTKTFIILQWRTQEFCSEGGSANSVEERGQREWGSGGGSALVRGSGGSCNLVQEISFHIVKFS